MSGNAFASGATATYTKVSTEMGPHKQANVHVFFASYLKIVDARVHVWIYAWFCV